MTLPTLSNTIKTYLYGSSSVPDNFVNSLLIRPHDNYSEINGISAQQFMTGPGRFALASSFKIVGDFFDNVNGYDVSLLFVGHTGNEVRLTKAQWASVLGLGDSFYGLSIDHKDFDDGQDNFADRVFLWGNTSFQISDAEFVVTRTMNPDGTYNYTKSIEDFAVLPRKENFDFVSSDGTTTQTQHVSRHATDPSGIGRRVDIVFVDDIPRETFTEAAYWDSVQEFGELGYAQFELNLPRQLQLQSGTQAIFDSIFSGGITAAVAADKLVVYGTDDNDTFSQWVTPAGIDLLKQFESVGPYSFLMPQFQLALDGLVYIAGKGTDVVNGTSREDIIFGGQGADQLYGSGGDDLIFFDADDTHVNGGSGRDVAFATGAAGVTFSFTGSGIESVIGGTDADTFTFGNAEGPLMAAGGGGADTFNITYGSGESPRIVWGGLGADIISLVSPNGDANENWFNPAGILAVTVSGLTVSSFAALTVDMLGLGSIELSKFAVIVLNPDSNDQFFVDGQIVNETSMSADPNLQAGDGGTVFDVQATTWLGGEQDVQAIFEDGFFYTTSHNVNFFELGSADDDNFIYVNGSLVEEGDWGIIWGDGNTADIQMSLEEANAYVENFTPSTQWYEPENDQPYGPWFAAGGEFSGTTLGANGEFAFAAPQGPDLSAWLNAA